MLLTPVTAWAVASAEPELEGLLDVFTDEEITRGLRFFRARGWTSGKGFLTPLGQKACDETLAAYVAAFGEPVPAPAGAA